MSIAKISSHFDKSVSMTKTAFGRIDELERDMRGGLLIKPGRRTAEEFSGEQRYSYR